MAIRVIPSKETYQESPWLNILFGVSIIFFFGVLLAFFLFLGLIGRTEKNIDKFKATLSAKTEAEKNLSQRVLTYQQKIKDIAPLLKEHKKLNNFFALLENLVHPQVFFTKFSFNAKAASVNLEGEAENFQALSQQQEFFEKNPSVQKVQFDKAFLTEGGKVKFGVTLFLDPQLLKQ